MAVTLLSTSGSGNNVAVTFFISTVVPTQPAQQVTLGQSPASNPAFIRACQLTSEYLFIKRGLGAVAISLADLGAIAAAQVPALSYSPLITVQPVDATAHYSYSNAGNTASFNVSANSESTLTYAWREYTGGAWSANITNGTAHNATYVVSSNVLSVHPTTNEINGAGYVCIVYNSTGSTNSAQATLTSIS
jgi:hypothetical protein